MTTKEKISYKAESVGIDDMLELWVSSFHDDEHNIAVHEPLDYLESLKKLKISNNFNNLYKGKVLLLSFKKVDHALSVFRFLSKEEPAPYCQMYCFGKCSLDNGQSLVPDPPERIIGCKVHSDFKVI